MKMKTVSGAAMAAAAASLFMAGTVVAPPQASAKAAMGHCMGAHACKGQRAGKTALLWEGEPGEIRRLTYAELHDQVQRFSNVLRSLGVRKGDRVAV